MFSYQISATFSLNSLISTYIPFSNILQAIKVLAEQAVLFNLVGNQSFAD